MRDDPATPRRFDRSDLARFGVVLLVALAVRLAYGAVLDVPPFDPWRHLLLIDGMRSGDGFSLFGGQPYLWYQPIWHPIAALVPAGLGAAFPAALAGSAQAALWYPLARVLAPSAGRETALTAALGLALFGPLVRHTTHYGPEAFALLLVTIGLLVQGRGRGAASAVGGGVLFGIGTLARLNLGPLALLALPLARGRSRAALFSAGVALPLLAGWWRNRSILERFDWVFTWDGLAVRSSAFDAAAAFMPQRQPAIAEALSRLHAQIVPVPEWLRDAGGLRWETILLLALGVVAVAVARQVALMASAAVLLGYLMLLDGTGSSNFFRLYLPLFPIFFTAAALAVRGPAWRRALPVSALLLVGLPAFAPPSAPPLEHVVPPDGTLRPGRTYAVTSGFFHPEALAYATPGIDVVGLPLLPERLDAFLDAHPAIDAIVLHDFTVQPELVREIERRFGPPVRRTVNPGGYGHRVYERSGSP